MFTVYGKVACPQCDQAASLLSMKGKEFRKLTLGADYEREDLLEIAPGARQVPQVFFEGNLIGGLPELRKFLAS